MKKPSAAQWRYCAKVGIATALGYALTQGGQNQYAIYSAFTAALIVGTSVGEDLATSANRVKGTLAGMVAGMAVSALVGPSLLAIGASAAFTALLAILMGWGIPVARIGVTVCVITLAVHHADALSYDLYRALNTIIGIVAGLAVTFFIWPVRGQEELARTTRDLLAACRALLDAAARGEKDLLKLEGKVHDCIGALVKAARDEQLERKAGHPVAVNDERTLETIQLGVDVLAAGLRSPATGALEALGHRVDRLTARP
jgi:uncharacterized membrane protein YccC